MQVDLKNQGGLCLEHNSFEKDPLLEVILLKKRGKFKFRKITSSKFKFRVGMILSYKNCALVCAIFIHIPQRSSMTHTQTHFIPMINELI